MNQWVTSAEAWLPTGAWDALEAKPAPKSGRIVLGFDGSYTDDSTALIGCTIPGEDEVPQLFVVKVWESAGKHQGWTVPREEVDAVLGETMRRFQVVNVRDGAWLQAQTFPPPTIDEALGELCDLVDEEACTPNCLFGQEEGPCSCRCGGLHHSRARGADPIAHDDGTSPLDHMPDHCDRCWQEMDPDDWVRAFPYVAIRHHRMRDTIEASYECDRCHALWRRYWNPDYVGWPRHLARRQAIERP